MIIVKNDGTPYASGNVAINQAKAKNLTEYKIVETDGGWGIEVKDASDPIEVKAEQAPVEKVKTEPVVKVTRPWTPANRMAVPDKFKTAGRRYRWVNTNAPGNLEQSEVDGWVIDHDVSKNRRATREGCTVEELEFRDKTQSLDTTSRIAELILMWMPETMAKERNKYYATLADGGVAQIADQFNSELQESGAKEYKVAG